jgi:hypothetical protein
VKACVAGYGHADKKQMQMMVRVLLSMAETPEPADAADALAVALCHIQAEQTRRRFGLADTARFPGARSLRGSARDASSTTRVAFRRIVTTR